MMSQRINPKRLFDDVSEGDKLMFGDRSEPVTVYRHVTEDDLEGQVITMKVFDDEDAEMAHWEAEHGVHDNDRIRVGDLITGDKTGEEFLIARGPRGGCYLLEQWWSKQGGEWSASVALHRRTREDTEVWTWENTVDLERVGSEDVDRERFDVGGDWIRHTEVQGRMVWENFQDGEGWEHGEDLTGVDREPEDTGPEPWEELETVSEGDRINVNGNLGTVSEVSDEYGGALADGVTITLDVVGGGEMRIRTYPHDDKAALMGPEIDPQDVEDVVIDG